MLTITLFDIVVSFLYLYLIYFVAKIISKRTISDEKFRLFFIFGLFAKIFGGISFVLVTLYYYRSNDSTLYFTGVCELLEILKRSPSEFFTIFIGQENPNFGIPKNMPALLEYSNSYQNLSVIRYTSVLGILGLKNYLATTILVAAVNYVGVWKLYSLFAKLYPKIQTHVAISILFLPSVLFYGSGILKDSYTLNALSLFICYTYKLRYNIGRKTVSIIIIVISSFVLLAIKPYLFYIVFISVIVWFPFSLFKNMKYNLIKMLILIPIIFIFWFISSNIILNYYENTENDYVKFDNIVQRSKSMSQDFQNEKRSGENFFHNDGIDRDLTKLFKSTPIAIFNGIFRPWFWEANNFQMFVSGVESLIILSLTIFIMLLGVKNIFKNIFKNNFLIAFLFFSFTLAFFLGNTIANFGTLTRLRIPLMPLFVTSLIVIWHQFVIDKENKIEI